MRSASVVLGREPGNWGDLQAGVTRRHASTRVVVPELPDTVTGRAYDITEFLRYRIDTLDSLGFPSRGVLLDAVLERSPNGGDNGTSPARSSVIGMTAVHTENWAGHLYGKWARAGFSLEAGGGFDQDEPLARQRSALKQAGSGFLSVDTRFGLVYLGAGAARDGNRTLYLFLRAIW